jgi:hypothetical protein
LRILLLLAACSSSGDPKPCDLVGKWSGSPLQGNFAGERVTQIFNADTTYEIDLNDAPFFANWKLEKNRLTLSEDTSCQSSQPAQYDLTFYGCDMAIYAIVSDDCMGRAMTLNGMSITKLPN